MEITLRKKVFQGKKTGQPGHCTVYLLDRTTGLYVESYFRDMLFWERRRTERSRKPFLLMLINVQNIPAGDKRKSAVKKIAGTMISVTRQTDTKGWYKYDTVIGIILVNPRVDDCDILKQKIYDELAGTLRKDALEAIRISTYVFPEEYRNHGACGPPDLKLYPDLTNLNLLRKTSFMAKRTMDIAGSIAGLIIFLPFFMVIPVLIKLTSKGPVLFKQERVGRFGKNFMFLKFRSMRVNNDDCIHKEFVNNFIGSSGKKCVVGMDGIYKIKDDPRVTKVGKILRKSSLDELPQFINVLKGDMSLVGPRPPIPYELEKYDTWHKRRILEMKPGITGLWQVKGRSSTSFDEMVRLDLKYITEWSLWSDVKVLCMTPWVVLTYKGAY